MNYIIDLAENIKKEVPTEKLPQNNTKLLFLIYAVLALTKGNDVSEADVHNAWSAWMSTVDANHPAIKEFNKLSKGTKAEDSIYVLAIKKAINKRRL